MTTTKQPGGLRCHDPCACALGQRPCPSPAACCCAPTEANASTSESEKENAARHYGAMALEASCALPEGVEPDGFLESHPFGLIFHRGKPSQMQLLCGACPPVYTADQVQAMGRVPPGCMAVPVELLQNAEQALANFVSEHDWGDADMVAMDNLSAALAAAPRPPTAPERKPLTDERIREIDDETHFHESPDWPVRFARAIEAELRKAPTP